MKAIFTFLLKSSSAILFFFLLNTNSKAQINAGTEFWFSFPKDNPLVTGNNTASDKQFFIISLYNNEVNFEWPAQNDALPPVKVTAGVPQTVNLGMPYTDYCDAFAETIDMNGIHITSKYPCAIYAISFQAATSEICPILPIEKIGKEYITIAYRELENTSDNFSSRVNVAATENNTKVTFELNEKLWTSDEHCTKQIRKPKDKWTITLQKGESYSIYCNDNGQAITTKPKGATPKTGTLAANRGLNGLKISATKNIVVLGGTDCTRGGDIQYPACGACDITFTQELPLDQWSKEFITTQTLLRSNNVLPPGNNANSSIADYLIITAKDSNTKVNLTGAAIATKTIQPGEFWMYESPGKGTDPKFPGATNHIIKSDKPITIHQIQKGYGCDGQTAADPSQMTVFDHNSWRNNYNITTPSGTAAYAQNFLVLLVKNVPPSTSYGNIQVFNSTTGVQIPVPPANWVQMGTEPYFYNRITLPAPSGLRLTGDSVFAFYASGSDFANSYAFMGGASCMFDIEAGADTVYITSTGVILPSKFQILSTVGGKLQKDTVTESTPTYVWTPDIKKPGTTLSGPNPSYLYSDTGIYTATVTVSDVAGCKATDTFRVYVIGKLPPPSVKDTMICGGNSVTLKASTTVPSPTLEWYDAPTGGNLMATGNTFTTPVIYYETTYYVMVKSSGYKSERAPVKIKISPLPIAAVAYVKTGKDISFRSDTSLGIFSWDWNFGDRSPDAHGITTSHTYLQNDVFTVTLIVNNKCGADTLYFDINVDNSSDSVKIGVKRIRSDVNGISVYPNPVKDRINVHLRVEKSSKLSIRIYDVLGREVYNGFNNAFIVAGDHTITIPLSENVVSNGLLFVSVKLNDEKHTMKVLKQ